MLTAIVALCVLAAVSWRLPAIWRTGAVSPSGKPPRSWSWGLDWWHAYARFVPTGCLFLLFTALTFLFGGVVSEAFLAGAAGCGILSATVFAFNWPRVLVPPPRRSDQGLLRLRRRRS